MMITPPFLKEGDNVGIVATARKIKPKDIEVAEQVLSSWGLNVILSPNLFSTDHSYLAGTDDQRLNDLQAFLNDASLKAIFCARGGYGTTRVLDTLDFNNFKQNPKWVVGFSDVTALHLALLKLGYESIHGTMPLLFSKKDAGESIESLRKILFGTNVVLNGDTKASNKLGLAHGQVIGGNLSLIVDSIGTPYEPDTRGKILVIEEVDEYRYRLDRMFVQIKRAKKLEGLVGLVVGHMTDIKDSELSFGETEEEIILYHCKDYNFPIGFNFPTGHENPNLAWRHGAFAQLTVRANDVSIKYD